MPCGQDESLVIWRSCWTELLKKNKSLIDLSSADLDGSHTTALRGEEQVAYQGRKKRNGQDNEDNYFDEQLYKQRYAIERTNAWLDSFRSLLNRFDTTISSWMAWNFIAFIVIGLKNSTKNKKSR